MRGTLYITGDPEADALLNEDGLALLIGMLLDQQVPMAWAFRGPSTLRQRLGRLDARSIAAMAPEDLVAVFVAKPALHRFPATMARRTHELCAFITEHYDGRAEQAWEGVPSGAELFARLRSLPGFGDEKAQIFIALLVKRMGLRVAGWREAAGVFGDDHPRTVADSASPEGLASVMAWKRAMRAARQDKQGRDLPTRRPPAPG